MIEILKAILFGIVEGITEWLPVSSTGHLILLDEFLELKATDAFKSMFDVVIQLGAILAVIVLFFHKLNPFALSKSKEEKGKTWTLWFKVCVAILPSGILGVLFDDWMEEQLYQTYIGEVRLISIVVAIALILYGIAFLFLEKGNKGKHLRRIEDVHDISWKTAIFIGCFQALSLIPGTSRSGSGPGNSR